MSSLLPIDWSPLPSRSSSPFWTETWGTSWEVENWSASSPNAARSRSRKLLESPPPSLMPKPELSSLLLISYVPRSPMIET